MSLHSNSIFWSRIQSRFMAVLLSLSSGVSSNQEQASRFFLFFFFMTLTFWSIQANWFWRMSSILKLSDCFMIRSELNTLAEDARCCYCTLPPHHASSSSRFLLISSGAYHTDIYFGHFPQVIFTKSLQGKNVFSLCEEWTVYEWSFESMWITSSPIILHIFLLSMDDLCLNQYREATKSWFSSYFCFQLSAGIVV